MLIKKKPLEFVKAFAGKADMRCVLNGVLITADEMVATDGNILGRISQQKDLVAKDYPIVEGIDPSQSEEPLKPVIVPIDGIERLIKSIPAKKSTMPILKMAIVNTKVTNEGKLFLAGATDLETTTPVNIKQIEGTYPDYFKVIPQGEGVKQFHVDPAIMAKAMTAAAKLGLQYVKFAIPEKELSPIKITGRTEDNEDVTIVVVPCKEGKK